MKRQIPNILSVIRLIMVPIFIAGYFKFKPLVALFIYLLAWITDALDGYLARRNNWITDLGKILDPLADKLMQLSAAICFAIDNSIFLIVVIPMFFKEIAMIYASFKIKKAHNVVVVSHWYGKVATVLLFVCAFTRLIVRDNLTLDLVIAVCMLICMLFALLMYYIKDYKGKYNLNLFHK